MAGFIRINEGIRSMADTQYVRKILFELAKTR